MELATPLESLCRIILRAREYEAQVPGDFDSDEDPSNISDDGDEALAVLDDAVNTSVEEELQAALDDLADDQITEVLALCWIGQGTYEASDWDEALEAAADENGAVEELLEMPMMASVLEAGLAAFGLDCNGFGEIA
jgi:hypothetical protein